MHVVPSDGDMLCISADSFDGRAPCSNRKPASRAARQKQAQQRYRCRAPNMLCLTRNAALQNFDPHMAQLLTVPDVSMFTLHLLAVHSLPLLGDAAQS